MKPLPRHLQGMTLIEIMIGVTLIGVLAAFSVPEIVKLAPKFRARSEAMAFASKLNRIRTEALTQGTVVARLTEVSGEDFATMQVFIDTNGNQTFEASSDTYLWESGTTPVEIGNKPSVEIENIAFNDNNWIGFNSFGYPAFNSAGSVDFTGTLGDAANSKVTYTVSVTAGGTISVDLTSS